MLALLILAPRVLAAGYSADIELVNPTFGEGALPGADASWGGAKGTVLAGLIGQYSKDALVYEEGDAEIGSAVGARMTYQAGLSWNITDRIVANAFLPFVSQSGAADVEGAIAGGGVGDVGVGARVALLPLRMRPVPPVPGSELPVDPLDGRGIGVSLRADVRLPTGTQEAWLGEESVRGSFGPGFCFASGRIDVLTGANLLVRAPIDTPADLHFGSELAADVGVRARVVPGQFALYASAVARVGLSGDANLGSMPAEGLVGAQWAISPALYADLGLGHGLTTGYGSDRFRALVGFTYRHVKVERPEDALEGEPDAPDEASPDAASPDAASPEAASPEAASPPAASPAPGGAR